MFVSFTEMYGDKKGVYRISVRSDKGRRLGRTKRRRESNLKMGLQIRGMGRHRVYLSGSE